jgi:LPXTG-site transpeptidase (sortase) family protein
MKAVLRIVAARRVLLFTALFYAVVALLAAMPSISRALTEKQVHQQLLVAERVSTHATPVATVASATGLPVQLSIKRLGINFPVAKGYYNSASLKWTLDSNHVFVNAYTNPDPVIGANQTTDVVLYGHNFNNVLGKTTEMVPGDILSLRTDTGYQFNYYFVKSEAVNPNTTNILSLNSKQYPVMLVTCTGIFDQVRRVMYFTPLGSPVQVAAQSRGASV